MLEGRVLKPFDPGGKPVNTKKKIKRFHKLEVKKILKTLINMGTCKGRMLVYENEIPFNRKPMKEVLKKISIPKGRKRTKKKVVTLKSKEDWNDDELDILENISSNTQGIPNFLVDSLRDGLCKIDSGVKLHKRMYKDGSVKEKGKYNMRIADILFDTGASHSSYISKDLVDIYRDTWIYNMEKTNSSVTLGDN